jgi:bifunctional UDP-N-acetylglucosamine pyrophosphorylase/glucosamine-1-phosphate N-acetyltransferase
MHSIVILAGGMGKRMNKKYPNVPKVCIPIKGIPIIVRILRNAFKTLPQHIFIVVGDQKEKIKSTIEEYITCDMELPLITYVIQDIPQGTGHALLCCIPEFEKVPTHDILIICGDVPLLSMKIMNNVLNTQHTVIITAIKANPHGLGRIIQDKEKLVRIIEEKDCTDMERKIQKINCGIYNIKSSLLCKYLFMIGNDNAQKEYYLTDIIHILSDNGHRVDEYLIPPESVHECDGINTPEQLDVLEDYII